VVVHVFLLFAECADHRKPVIFPFGKGSAQSELFVNSGKVPCQIAQLFPNRLADLLCRFLSAATEL